MRSALIIIPLTAVLLLAGCGGITRAEYEWANPDLPKLAEFEVKDGKHAGATRVVYGPTNDARIDPETNVYTCPEGVRVVTYRDGVIVARWFQEHAAMRETRH